jgi:hypothetical protein
MEHDLEHDFPDGQDGQPTQTDETAAAEVRPQRRPFPGPTGFVLLTLLVIGLSVVVQGAIVGFLGLEISDRLPPFWMGIGILVNSLLWLLVAVAALRMTDGSLSSRLFLLLPRRHALPFMGLALLCGVVMVLPALWLQVVGARFLPQVDESVISQIAAFEKQNPSMMAVAILASAFIGGAALGEEVFFRGLVLGALERRYGFWIGAVVVSLVFTAVHVQPIALAPIFALSMLLCWLRHAAQSIWPAVICHASYNGVQVVSWLMARQQTDFTLQADPAKAQIPLGPVIGSLVLLMFFIYLLRRLRAGGHADQDQKAANINSF